MFLSKPLLYFLFIVQSISGSHSHNIRGALAPRQTVANTITGDIGGHAEIPLSLLSLLTSKTSSSALPETTSKRSTAISITTTLQTTTLSESISTVKGTEIPSTSDNAATSRSSANPIESDEPLTPPSKSVPVAAVAGGVLGGLVVLVGLIIGALWYLRGRRVRKNKPFDIKDSAESIAEPKTDLAIQGTQATEPVTSIQLEVKPSVEMPRRHRYSVGGL
ncbi:hypothetical protein H072_6488 [Dactylellina haptotyla CBS 200.50]|uniref:Mid2 domain-containing protein n=1 Tax=Dactylellina haptotyla (strain CBS 200.50) TaxID=1284197 RepID=S8BWL2_DACHA|nr:hypothetical protein H072_6488 [Dactylellina haptotyla CBS 200.50]